MCGVCVHASAPMCDGAHRVQKKVGYHGTGVTEGFEPVGKKREPRSQENPTWKERTGVGWRVEEKPGREGGIWGPLMGSSQWEHRGRSHTGPDESGVK